MSGEPTVTRRKQAPLASISETQLSDDERNPAKANKVRCISNSIQIHSKLISFNEQDNDLFSLTRQGPAWSTIPGESDEVSINSPTVINNENLCLNVELVKRPQRPMSVGPGICVPTSIYLDDNTRTFSNPLSYLGGPHLPVAQRASKESVLSIDD